MYVTECVCVCVSSFLFFDWVGVLWPELSEVLKFARWVRRDSFPHVRAEAGRLLVCVIWAPVRLIQGRAYTVCVCYSNR